MAEFDKTGVELLHKQTSEYDGDDGQTDYYTKTTLLYREKNIHEAHSHYSAHIGGVSGEEHHSSLSEDKRTLTITYRGVGKRKDEAPRVEQISVLGCLEKLQKLQELKEVKGGSMHAGCLEKMQDLQKRKASAQQSAILAR